MQLTKKDCGNGRLALCRYLVSPIDDQLLKESNEAKRDYRKKLNEYYAPPGCFPEKPEEPPMRMLILPANSSSTAVYQTLNDNNGRGLIFETEGDTLSANFNTDYGNFSDGFRKAFHHEPISYLRRKDREYVKIDRPKTNAEFWRTKIENNRERDLRDYTFLESLGWRVIVVWECELKKDRIDGTIATVREQLDANRESWIAEQADRRRRREEWQAEIRRRKERTAELLCK